jgi:ABC-type branched-subunit amino acid transport system substrate-binding protein
MRDAALLPLERLETSDFAITVEYQAEDSAGQVETGVEGAETLVDEGFPAIVGAMTSAVTLEVADRVFVPADVVSCSPSATTPKLTELDDSGYMVRTAPSDAFQGAVQAQVAIEHLDAETASVLFMDDAYGSALAETFENRFELRGGDVVETVPLEPEQDSYAAKLDTALGGDPDVLTVIAFTKSGAVIFDDYYAEHQGHDILVPDGLKTPDLMRQVENGDLRNVVGTAPVADGPNSDAFERRFREAYGIEPTIFAANSYDAAAVLMLASLAGDGTAPSIRDNLQSVANPGGKTIGPETLLDGARQVLDGTSVEYRGASSPVGFDRNGDIQAAHYEVWEYDPPDGFTQHTTVDISN